MCYKQALPFPNTEAVTASNHFHLNNQNLVADTTRQCWQQAFITTFSKAHTPKTTIVNETRSYEDNEQP
jgi:hypothetical protein